MILGTDDVSQSRDFTVNNAIISMQKSIFVTLNTVSDQSISPDDYSNKNVRQRKHFFKNDVSKP